MSMAAGENLSVSSQSDTERADLGRERKELSDNADFELDELTEIYVKRGEERQHMARQWSMLSRALPKVLLEARHAAAALKDQRNKTDKNDERGLAHFVRSGE